MSLSDQLKSVRLRPTSQPKEKVLEPLLCADSETYQRLMNETRFECYYEAIRKWTFPSMMLPMEKETIQALRDGHLLFKTTLSLDNDEKRTRACLEAFPPLLKLSQAIDACDIERPMFVRLSTRSPKDAILLLHKERFREIFTNRLEATKFDETSGLL